MTAIYVQKLMFRNTQCTLDAGPLWPYILAKVKVIIDRIIIFYIHAVR